MEKKIASLDLGDRWVGVALADPLNVVATPYETVERKKLIDYLKNFITTHNVSTVVVGYPITMRGTMSQQTKATVDTVEQFKKTFSDIAWILWDERLTSKQAAALKKAKDPKHREHAVAAAFILQGYLDHLAMQKSFDF